MLSEVRIKTAKPKEKPYKLYDGCRLYLYITLKGTKSWRFDYKFGGKVNPYLLTVSYHKPQGVKTEKR